MLSPLKLSKNPLKLWLCNKAVLKTKEQKLKPSPGEAAWKRFMSEELEGTWAEKATALLGHPLCCSWEDGCFFGRFRGCREPSFRVFPSAQVMICKSMSGRAVPAKPDRGVVPRFSCLAPLFIDGPAFISQICNQVFKHPRCQGCCRLHWYFHFSQLTVQKPESCKKLKERPPHRSLPARKHVVF